MLINVWAAVPATVISDRKLDRADEEVKQRADTEKADAIDNAGELDPKGKPGRAPKEGPVIDKETKGARLTAELKTSLRKVDENHTPEFKAPRIRGKLRELQDLYFPEDEVEQAVAELEKAGAVILGDWRPDGRRWSERPLHPDLIQYMPARRAPPEREGEQGAELSPVIENVSFLWGHEPRQFV